jgi:EAL domain-containing protein (putative c-di-GMP-specific phosphodiesterase class I)
MVLGPLARKTWPPAGAALLLAAIISLQFLFPQTVGIMTFSIVPIVLLGMMLGPRAGLLAALISSAAYAAWAITEAPPRDLHHVAEPLAYVAFGLISGYFAHGALGEYDRRTTVTCNALGRAMARDEVVMHFQPIVRGEGDLLGAEALARWQHPKRGLLPPGEFIPTAERDEQTILELTLHTLELAVREASDAGIRGGALTAFNLSPVSLRRPELPGLMGGLLEDAGFPPQGLAVEVTETALAEGDDSVADVLAEIKELGVGMVAIDDFGIGNSSLGRLGRLPIDALKIDRTLVGDLERDQTRVVVDGIVQLGHAMGLTVVAEGVEDERTLRRLEDMGCDAVQGFHLSRPLPPEELKSWISDRPGAVSASTL